MRLLRLSVAGLSSSLLFGCTELPVIEDGVCGNAVLEKEVGEDCDTFVDSKDWVCRPKGAVGECHFDCAVNADNEHAACPDDMGCAPDGICRRKTDDFNSRVPLSADSSSWLSTLDFDGDGRPELLSAEPADQFEKARFRLHYFDPAGALAETRTFPHVVTRPIARTLDDHPASELIFSNFRIGMLPGRADRDWVPATFSSYVVPDADIRAVGVRKDVVDLAAALVALTKLNGVWGAYVPSYLHKGALSLRGTPFAHPVSQLAGAPVAGNIVLGDDSPCDELVLAFTGDTSFRMLDLCRVGDDPTMPALEVVWREAAREKIVSLPEGLQIDAGPLVADVDGDGFLDVLIGAGHRAYVAHGDGTSLENVAEGPLDLPSFGTSDVLKPSMPLAAGDVSGDGIADFVFSDGVKVSRKSLADGLVGYFQSYINAAQPWSMAEIADLNGNGRPDIVAAAAGAPGLTFLNGTDGPFQISAALATRGPVRFLAAGDYDGDLIGDVAFIEGGSPRSPTDQLAVAFGARDGVPLPAKRVAELSGVKQLSDHPQNGLDELFTSSLQGPRGRQVATFTLFDGGPDRLPFAPYSLVTFSQDGQLQDQAALALTVGAFTAAGASDVVVMGGNDDPKRVWDLWLIQGIGAQNQPPLLLTVDAPPKGAIPFTVLHDGSVRLSVASAAADLEGDGFDEALWLMPQGDKACALLRYDIDGGKSEALARSQLLFDEPCATPELSAADLNADKRLDLLLLLGNPEVAPRRLQVLWNDGHGGFSLDDRSFISDAENDVRAFSVFPDLNRRFRRVAFVTSSALHVTSWSRTGLGFDVVRDFAPFDDARAVSVLDPNTDNNTDLVVADAEGLWLVGAKLR